jgi:hypothetical protein
MPKQKSLKSLKEQIKTRHYFFLSTYQEEAFTKCPKCNNKTKVRKFPLAIGTATTGHGLIGRSQLL